MPVMSSFLILSEFCVNCENIHLPPIGCHIRAVYSEKNIKIVGPPLGLINYKKERNASWMLLQKVGILKFMRQKTGFNYFEKCAIN
jgi:hypothetical protein